MKTKKIRISALAKEIGKTSKEMLDILKDLGIPAKTHASTLDEESVKIIKDLLVKKTEPLPPPVVSVPVPTPPPVPEFVPTKSGPLLQTKEPPVIKISESSIAIKDLSDLLNIKPSEIIKELMKKGFLININQGLAPELAVQVIEQFGAKAEIVRSEAKKHEVIFSGQHKLKTRPPVVTIMGHVDHGKTKLLDAIRESKLTEAEAGGITQHIGAYQVEVKGKKITFLDTPGHEAFTALRARGAKVTDIAVLVVAADDGVMPQTIEAIDHARAAGVPIIVAINKIDKPDANPDRVKQQLSDYKLVPEEWGGDTVMVAISAKQKKNINELLDMILLLAEVQELKANYDVSATGVVIESKLDKGRGPVATILVKNGTLKVGDAFVIGGVCGKVRALATEFGERLKKAEPSSAVEVFGISDVPQPGELVEVLSSEKEAREEAGKHKQAKTTRHSAQSLEAFSQNIKKGERKDLIIIIKADVQGSLEALIQSLKDLDVSGSHVRIIHSQTGDISESDVLLAKASEAIIIGFHTNVQPRAAELSKTEAISIRLYDVIYKVIEDVKMAMEGMLSIEYEEVVIGLGEVRATFKYSKVGVIAGSFVNSGKFIRGAGLRVIRDGKLVFQGKLESLKRFKEDVKEVEQGFECGVSIKGYTDFVVGDQLEVFEMQAKENK